MLNGLGQMTLSGVERGRQQELGHAQDAVHRCPDLMTHVGEELRFGSAGRLGFFGEPLGFLRSELQLTGPLSHLVFQALLIFLNLSL